MLIFAGIYSIPTHVFWNCVGISSRKIGSQEKVVFVVIFLAKFVEGAEFEV